MIQFYETTGNLPPVVVQADWTIYPPHTYRVMAWLIPEAEGGYSVVSINLPGCCTQGETVGECVANLKEAATGAIEAYHAHGEKIPWVKSPMPRRPKGAKRITVYVTVPPNH